MAKKPALKRRKSKDRGDEQPVLRLLSYEITWEPQRDEQQERLPLEDRALLEWVIRSEIAPDVSMPRLLELVEEYPEVPLIHNLICATYERLGEPGKALDWTLRTYRRFPDYLFAKLNMASVCLLEGAYEIIPSIFDGKYDLSLLYPNRRQFHVSEYMTFSWIMGTYFHAKGDRRTAELYLDGMSQIDEKHHLTRRLQALLRSGRPRRFEWV